MTSDRRLQVVAMMVSAALLGGTWLATRADGSAGPASGGASRGDALADLKKWGREQVSSAELHGLTFRDETMSAGFAAPHLRDGPRGSDKTGGAAVADYDDDGRPDVFLTRVGYPNRLMHNEGDGRFTDVAITAGVAGPDPKNGYAAAVWADVNSDGRFDLFVTGAGATGPVLYINDGGGRFTDETTAAGLDVAVEAGGIGFASYGAAFGDWAHDGHLSLLVTQWYTPPFEHQVEALLGDSSTGAAATPTLCGLAAQRRAAAVSEVPLQSRTRFYRNDGTGHFTDVTPSMGIDTDQIVAFQPQFVDVNGDGWDDLLITGDYCTSRIYLNDHGKFVDRTDAAGVGTDENGMGSVVEDLNGDGFLDWFITSIYYPTESCPAKTFSSGCSGNRLYLGDGRGHFTDATDRFGVRNGGWGWGAAAQDLNNDGWRDLVMTNGLDIARSAHSDEPSVLAALHRYYDQDATRLWIGTSGGVGPQAANTTGLRHRVNGKALVAFDATGNGNLDLLVVSTEGQPIFYRNLTPSDADHGWLTLRLRDPGTNRFGIGARVLVTVRPGMPAQPMQVRAGGSFESGDPTDLHVGLGSARTVARIEVYWPGDPNPQVLTDVQADQVLSIDRPG